MKVKSGKHESRKIVITGTSEEFENLARALSNNFSWSEVEEEYEIIKDGFLANLYDALTEDAE